jgi:hypothetical protein
MSPDHEDTALEEALRDDLPSPETSARVRRRLLAAGLAVGNGVAVTTAAAAGATPGVAVGMVSKGLALSWGFKLGALAVVAIPTVGLLVETSAEPQLAPPPPNAAPLSRGSRGPSPAPGGLANTQGSSGYVEPAREAGSNLQASRELPQPAVERAAIPERSVTTEALPARPSQVDFATPESAAAARASSTLAEETRLLDSAFAELAAGNAAQAAVLIAEHERRFPAGLLQKERLRAKARLSEVHRGE